MEAALETGEPKEEADTGGAKQRPNDRDPCVTPIGAALAGDRQYGVSDAWAKVTCGINGVTGGPAEG